MRTLIIAAAALALGAAPAFAQNNAPYNTPAGPDTGYQSNGSSYSGQQGWHHDMYGQHHGHYARLEHRIRHQLSQAGFSDIRIMPRSFIVRARDPQGNPFMMIMNPHSVTAIRAVPGNGNHQYSQNGNWGMTGSSAMNNSGQSGNAINSPNGNGTYTR